MIARRRSRRQSSESAGGMTQQDLEAIRTYRMNRKSKVFYRDLQEIDNKAPSAPARADKDEK